MKIEIVPPCTHDPIRTHYGLLCRKCGKMIRESELSDAVRERLHEIVHTTRCMTDRFMETEEHAKDMFLHFPKTYIGEPKSEKEIDEMLHDEEE